MKAVKFLAWCLVWLIVFFYVLWPFGAHYYDFPIPGFGQWAAILFVVILLAALILVRGKARKLGSVFLAFVLVLVWWRTSNIKFRYVDRSRYEIIAAVTAVRLADFPAGS